MSGEQALGEDVLHAINYVVENCGEEANLCRSGDEPVATKSGRRARESGRLGKAARRKDTGRHRPIEATPLAYVVEREFSCRTECKATDDRQE